MRTTGLTGCRGRLKKNTVFEFPFGLCLLVIRRLSVVVAVVVVRNPELSGAAFRRLAHQPPTKETPPPQNVGTAEACSPDGGQRRKKGGLEGIGLTKPNATFRKVCSQCSLPPFPRGSVLKHMGYKAYIYVVYTFIPGLAWLG